MERLGPKGRARAYFTILRRGKDGSRGLRGSDVVDGVGDGKR